MSGVVKTLISPLGAALGLFKKPKIPGGQRPVTRDDAAAAVARDDELRRRRGAGANLVTGPSGAEASTAGGKTLLGQ